MNRMSDFSITTIVEELVVEWVCSNDTGEEVCGYEPDLQETVDTSFNNVVDLQIYYRNLNKETIEERPAYTFLALLCDVGGAMGLILGATILTVAEVSEFLYHLIYDALMFQVSKCSFVKKRINPTFKY